MRGFGSILAVLLALTVQPLMAQSKATQCAQAAKLSANDIITEDALADRVALRNQIKRDMQVYFQLKNACPKLAKTFRGRADTTKSILKNFSLDGKEKARQLAQFNNAILGATAVIIPVIGSIQSANQQSQSNQSSQSQQMVDCLKSCNNGQINVGVRMQNGQCFWEATCTN